MTRDEESSSLRLCSQERGNEQDLGGDGQLDEGVGWGLREVQSTGGRGSRGAPSRLIRPKRGAECHDVRAQSPRLGSPSRPGSEHEPPPLPRTPEPWLAAAHQATHILQRNEPSGSFKAARQPPSPRTASHPPHRCSTAGWRGRCAGPRGRPQQSRQHEVTTMPGLGSGVHREASRPRVSDDPFHMVVLNLLRKHEKF